MCALMNELGVDWIGLEIDWTMLRFMPWTVLYVPWIMRKAKRKRKKKSEEECNAACYNTNNNLSWD